MTIRKAYFAFVLLSALAGTAGSTPPPSRDAREQEALEDGCDRSQMNMNICSFYDYKVLDAELNTNYTRQLARLKGSQAAKRLIAAQRAWLRYAESDCLYQTGPAKSLAASGHSSTTLACRLTSSGELQSLRSS